jgi:predicted nucleotidyltransferase component of viral defense system
MHNAVTGMLEKYNCKTIDDYRNALKEIIQEIALLGLFRGNFFDNAAFYGGTALRIFYDLDRFSEDIDFSLIKKSDDFDIEPFCELIKKELAAYGFDVEVTKKKKVADSNIESAFIKGGTLIHMLKVGVTNPPIKGITNNELLKIKIEVDTDPPDGAAYEVKYLLNPIPFSVRLFSSSSLFAGKIHALLFRNWKNGRMKGRDLYDYVWYLSKSIPVNIHHLEGRMRQTQHLKDNATLNIEQLHNLLFKRFSLINYEQAKQDVLPFIKNPDALKIWSADFFNAITRNKLVL